MKVMGFSLTIVVALTCVWKVIIVIIPTCNGEFSSRFEDLQDIFVDNIWMQHKIENPLGVPYVVLLIHRFRDKGKNELRIQFVMF